MKTDVDIRQNVEEELASEAGLDASRIAVSVREGIVTLIGHVPTFGEKVVAERAAARVVGVRAVADEIGVLLHRDHERNDDDIAASCVRALEANCEVPEDSTRVVVSNGHVTLEGEVDSPYRKHAAERAVRYVRGVRGLVNNIAVRPYTSAQIGRVHSRPLQRRPCEPTVGISICSS